MHRKKNDYKKLAYTDGQKNTFIWSRNFQMLSLQTMTHREVETVENNKSWHIFPSYYKKQWKLITMNMQDNGFLTNSLVNQEI